MKVLSHIYEVAYGHMIINVYSNFNYLHKARSRRIDYRDQVAVTLISKTNY